MRNWVYRLLVFLAIFISNFGYAQQFVLNQGFTNSHGTTPPSGWEIKVEVGDANHDVWHFDNPGGQSIMFPITPPFAIFDASILPPGHAPQRVALQSRPFNASGSNFFILMFDHTFSPGGEEQALLEVNYGDGWRTVAVWDEETSNPKAEVINISPNLYETSLGEVLKASMIRFIWDGNGIGFWALDNIRVYQAFQYDAALLEISSPAMPFAKGEHEIRATLGNFGTDPLTSVTLHWAINDQEMGSVLWSGNLYFGQKVENIVLGTYNFQEPVLIRVWVTLPAGQIDGIPINDSVERLFRPALSGDYTIGGDDPDFADFREASEALNAAGVNSPVRFVVRPGAYTNQVTIGQVDGSSAENTITFESENGDPMTTELKFGEWLQATMRIRGTQHIHFRNIGFFGGYNGLIIEDQASDVSFKGCIFKAGMNFAVNVRGGTKNIRFEDNRFNDSDSGNILSDTALVIGQMGYEPVRNVQIIRNRFGNKTPKKAIQLYATQETIIDGNVIDDVSSGIGSNSCGRLTIRNNRIQIIGAYGSQSAGIELVLVEQATLYNNFIYTHGFAPSTGIRLKNTLLSEILFNSMNITNKDVGDNSTALWVEGGDQFKVLNNIFNIEEKGAPIILGVIPAGSQIDYNNYHHPKEIIGRFQEITYSNIYEWRTAIGYDDHSLAVYPFFTSDNDLTINQILLNNAGMAISGIDTDIDGSPRHISNPDIGAKEYDPCDNDAGINRILSPASPVESGYADVRVELQNQGTDFLHEVTIQWTVNGMSQDDVELNSLNLESGENMDVLLGTFDFSQDGFYIIHAWTSLTNDCNLNNNSVRKMIMVSGALCGDYYIGDQPGDHFSSFSQAVLVLRTSGIGNCPVRFLVRGGVYEEQIVIGNISGTSLENQVTFQADPDNDSPVQLHFIHDEQTPVRLSGSSNVVFKDIEFQGHYAMIIENQSSHILLENCALSVDDKLVPVRPGLVVRDGSNNITLRNNNFSGGLQSVTLEHGSNPIHNVNIIGNTFSAPDSEAVYIQSALDIDIADNFFDNVSRGVKATNTSGISIWGNKLRLKGQYGHDNIGVDIQGGTLARVFNNYILGMGQAASVGIKLDDSQDGGIFFNSIHIANNDPEGNNKALWLINGTSNKVKNNIFMVRRAGDPVHIQGTPSQLTIDYNNYYSTRGRIGRQDQLIYHNLDEWRHITSDDNHSLSVNPFFPPDDGSQIDLSMNQVLLKNAGIPVDDIDTDIAGNIRDVDNPDTGAKEHELCTTDAGINAIISPGTVAQSIPGGQELRVLLQNHGTDPLYSANVFIHIEGAGVDKKYEYAWGYPAGLPGGHSAEVLFDETFDFYNGLYTLKAWTESPNGQTDCNLYNDTTEISVVASLCGSTYTIGGPDPDFSNFSDAIAVLNAAGITCPVVFNVRDGVYEERFVIGNISGTTTENMVVFIAENGSDANVIIQPETGGQAAVIFRDAHHIEFRYIEFVGQHAVAIADQSSNIIFDECSFNTRRIAIELEATGSDHIFITNNSFSGIGDYRSENYIMIRGNENVFSENVIIKNNVFTELLFQALHITAARYLTIEENHFEGIQMGILAINTRNMVMNSNWFHIISRADRNNMGVTIEGGEDIDIYNNFMRCTGIHPIFAIGVFDAGNTGIYFNTLNIRNTNAESKALWLQQGTSVVVKNNILNAPEAYPIYIDVLPHGLVIDHNNYYNATGLIGYNDISISEPNAWESAIGGDSNSSYLDPLFASDELPLPYEKFLNGAGETILLIAHDIYDRERFEPPDIGCMEFFIDYGIVGLVAPLQQCSFTDEEDISVVVERYGDIPLEAFDISVKINNGDEYTETIDGNFEGIYTHTFSGTFDLSDYKDYEIIISLHNVHDDNQNNDRGRYPLVHPEPVTVSYAILHETCAGRDDGYVTLDVSGGIAPYTIILNEIEQGTFQIDDFPFVMENLTPGTYDIIIVDKLSCEEQVSVEIEPAELLVPVIYATYENGMNYPDSIYKTLPFEVEFSFTVNDEDLLDSWLWHIGTITKTSNRQPKLSFEKEGRHEVILDVYSAEPNLCWEQSSFIVNAELPELSVDVELQHQLCVDGDLGTITLTMAGGIPPFTVIFNGDTLETTDRMLNYSGLLPGAYPIRVMDGYFEPQVFTDVKYLDQPVHMNPEIKLLSERAIVQTPVGFTFTQNGGSDPVSHEWRVGNIISYEREPEFIFDDLGKQTVELIVFSGSPGYCIEQTSFTFDVELNPMTILIVPYPQNCINHTLAHMSLAIEGGTPPYTIRLNDDIFGSTYDQIIEFPDLLPGYYSIGVEDNFGQSQTSSSEMPVPLSMNPAIFATDEYGVIHTDRIYGVIPFDISFSVNVDKSPASYTWYYDNQTYDNSSVIPITVNEEGETKIFLEVHSGGPYNCMEVAEYTIVAEQKVVIIPVEVITPDGGGPNEYFEVISKGLVSLEVDIYDRRGRRVYGYAGLDGRWHGDYDNGNEAPDGMYPFYLRGIGFDDHNYEQAGLIRLIREATNLFPNPASQFVHLDLGRTIHGPVNVEIINYKGERILYDTLLVVDKLVTMDVSGLLEGVYLLRLSDGNILISKKLIIARP